jgi:hypothetical protein
MSTVVPSAAAQRPSPGVAAALRHRPFYVALSLLLTAMVIVGFWPSYYGPLVRGAATRPWLFHLHGAVFLGWMALLIAQVALVAVRQTRLHRAVGKVGIGYGILVLVMGLLITFAAPVGHVTAGEWSLDQGAGFLLLPLGDMVLWAGFFGAAVAYRRQPEIHKRLIVVATICLAFAAVFRRVPAQQTALFLTLWFTPLAIAMAYDYMKQRRVHPVYLVATPVLLIAFMRVFYMESEGWLRVGRAMLTPLL